MAVAENERTDPRFVKWKPRPEIAHEPDAAQQRRPKRITLALTIPADSEEAA